MAVIAALLAQAPGSASLSVIPRGSTFTLLGWLALYVTLLFVWAITSTYTTMAARRTAGRSVIVRWVSAAVGLTVFVAIPALAARLLLPGALLLAVVPVLYSTTLVARQAPGMARGTVAGTGQTVFLTYRVALRLCTAVLELAWTALRAVLKLDWAKLGQLPGLARQTMDRLVPFGDRVPEVVILQGSGRPVDFQDDARLKSFPTSAPARLVNLLRDSVGMRASEILVSTGGQPGGEIRFRIDGAVVAGPAMSAEEVALVARLAKTLAGLNVSKVGQTQEGAIPIMCGDRRSEVSVTTASSGDRETMTLRIAGTERALFEGGLDGLGMDDAALAALRRLLANPEGLVLVVGRPDSGKSTTIYAALSEAVHSGRSVATVEAAPRHRLENVPQVRPEGTGRFAAAIDAALRNDPEVLAVRDILDRETAEACLRAAVSGRLVVAGFRADNAADAVRRLIALGVDRGLLRLAVTGIVSQRLARTLCESCKTAYQPKAELLGKLGINSKETVTFHREAGCGRCRGTGFQGRTGVFELLVVDDGTRAVLAAGDVDAPAARDAVRKSLARSLHQSALAKVRLGVTSVQEIAQVLK